MTESKSDQELIQELFAEVKALRAEIKALRTENEVLRAENAALREQVKDLEEKLRTNSRNSSQSPSQDPYRKRQGRKKPSGKKQGGQPGHQGHCRDIQPPEQVTEYREIRPAICPSCGEQSFETEPIATEIRQVTELPEIKPVVIQYNIHTCACSSCGCHAKAETPAEAMSAFGPRLKGFISLVTGDLGITKRKVVSLAGYLNIKLSVGSVCNIHHLAGQILAEPYEHILKRTLTQQAVNADETSWFCRGKRKWLWVVTGRESACFRIDPNRSSEAFCRVLGGLPQTIPLTTDRLASYNTYEGPRQNCWSHLDRDFEKIESRSDVDGLLGARLKEEADIVFGYWQHFQQGLLTRKELQVYMEVQVIPCVKALLKLGSWGQGCSKKTQGTCKQMLSQFDSFWTYLYHEGVEPTNNLAERDLRPAVIQRKLSYGTQTEAGEKFMERILSVVVTFKKQSKDLFAYLTECFAAHCRDGPIPQAL